MQNDDTQFAPFVPPSPAEGGQATDPAKPNLPFDTSGKPDKPKRNRKSAKKRVHAAAKPKIPAAPKYVRPKRAKKKKTAKKRVVGKRPELAAPYASRVKKSRTLKMSLTDAMAISALLKSKDFAMFDSLTETLQSVNKATRKRILAAIFKVFG